MVIFSHRGIGFDSKENSLGNFKNAIKEGFSIEADLRINGERVILSHDERKETLFEFEGLMELVLEYPNILFALHLKGNSEVLISRVIQAIYGKNNCFIFCTDLPQEPFIKQLHEEIPKNNLALYITKREVSRILVNKVDYLWLDETKQEIYRDLSYFMEFNKKIICCSPELYLSRINDKQISSFDKVAKEQNIFGICTDFPRKYR
jgi:hypothetical protein